MKTILVFSVIILLLDSLYLRQIAPPFGKMMKRIQGSPMETKLLPAAVVYLALVGAWYVFIYTHLKDYSYRENLVRAGLLGLFIYSVFDFTNLAVIDRYELHLAVIDSIWGGILFASSTALFLWVRRTMKL